MTVQMLFCRILIVQNLLIVELFLTIVCIRFRKCYQMNSFCVALFYSQSRCMRTSHFDLLFSDLGALFFLPSTYARISDDIVNYQVSLSFNNVRKQLEYRAEKRRKPSVSSFTFFSFLLFFR